MRRLSWSVELAISAQSRWAHPNGPYFRPSRAHRIAALKNSGLFDPARLDCRAHTHAAAAPALPRLALLLRRLVLLLLVVRSSSSIVGLFFYSLLLRQLVLLLVVRSASRCHCSCSPFGGDKTETTWFRLICILVTRAVISSNETNLRCRTHYLS